MPTSDHRQISLVLDVVLRREPRSVLDIGAGFGKYGTLIREYLPDVKLAGVEPWEEYATTQRGSQARWWAYDGMIGVPWPSESVRLHSFDLALMIDVIEHFPEPERLEAVGAALTAAKSLVVATPHDPLMWPQDELENPLEKHYDAMPLYRLADIALSCGARLVECHWLPDSYIAILERS